MGMQTCRAWALGWATVVLVACGGGGGGGGGDVAGPAPAPGNSVPIEGPSAGQPAANDPPADTPIARNFSIGGTVTGLAGTLTLRDALGNQVALTADGAFTIAPSVPGGTVYAVHVDQQPQGQQCVLANGTGTLAANMTGIQVSCAALTYPIRVRVVSAPQVLTITDSVGGTISVGTAGSVTLAAPITWGQAFNVGVTTFAQTCTVVGGSGVANGQAIEVEVTCAAQTWSVGGAVAGLAGTLQLSNSDGQIVTVGADGAFQFADRLAHGVTYDVRVAAQPAGQLCSIDRPSGQILAPADVTTIAVTCAAVPPPPATPGAPNHFLPGAKTHEFGWAAVPGATSYDFFEDPDGPGPLPAIQRATGLATPRHVVAHDVLLHHRTLAEYSWRACNAGGCSALSTAYRAGANHAIGYFKASNTNSSDGFGRAVALSQDGSTMVVGALQEDGNGTGGEADNSASNAGAVYVFVRAGGVWTQQAYLKASNPRRDALFGRAVALSADGNTLAVGADGESSGADGIGGDQADASAAGAGAVYVFTRSGGAWTQQAYVKAGDSQASDAFGAAVALSASGDTLAVGAHGHGNSAGAVYLFNRAGTAWAQQARVRASSFNAGDVFGVSVALSADGNTMAAGASLERNAFISFPNIDNLGETGAAYVFTRTGSAWTQQAHVKPDNLATSGIFGLSVALAADGNTLAVGAPRDDGESAGVNGSRLRGPGGTSLDTGAAYVFTRSGATWSQQAYVKASNPQTNDRFGYTVAISGDGNVLAVQAIGEASAESGIGGSQADNSRPSAGAVYLFGRDGSTWSQQAYLKAKNTPNSSYFGFGLSLSGDGNTLAAGADGDGSNARGIQGNDSNTSAPESGAVYLY